RVAAAAGPKGAFSRDEPVRAGRWKDSRVPRILRRGRGAPPAGLQAGVPGQGARPPHRLGAAAHDFTSGDRLMTERPVYRTELTPVSFLERTAAVLPDRIAVVHGGRRHPDPQVQQRTH